MAFLDRLLKRWGFVKLSRYGMMLTPEGRIIPIAAPVLLPEPAPVAVAPAPQVDEDDWEWTIALARARAAAEEATAAARLAATKMPLAARESAQWPATVTGANIDYNDYADPTTERTRPSARRVPPPPPRFTPTTTSPGTVIPVPRLPNAVTIATRAVPPPVPVAARRLAKGTGPVIDATLDPTTIGVAPAPPRQVITPRPPSDDLTVPGAPALMVGDRTSPGITALPSTRSRSPR